MNKSFVSIPEALEALRQGRMIILVDDEKRENEGDLVIAAEKVTAESINFMIKHGGGLICMPMTGAGLDRLGLPLMVNNNTSKYKTAFTVSIGAATGISTGISAPDRARTVQVAVSEQSSAKDISTPGHIFPLRAQEGGVLTRAGHTEGSVDLARLAGLKPAAVLCEVLKADGTMARLDDLVEFAKIHQLPIVSINDLITYRINHETLITELSSSNLPLQPYGEFTIKIFESHIDHAQHVALISKAAKTTKNTLVRLHSECLTGDIFGSSRCDCGWQLRASLQKIGKEGGVLLYMRQEGRGIGLANKIKAYALQEQGYDTVEANEQLGFAADQRDYGMGAQILRQLGIKQISLLTNNPAKIAGMERYGIEVVSREPLESVPNKDNVSYLRAKQSKLGHLLAIKPSEE